MPAAKSIHIKDRHFIRRMLPVKRARGHNTMTKTVQQLAEERLIEIQTGAFLPVSDVSTSTKAGAKDGEGVKASVAA